jgi:hypothetical protein
MPTQFAETTPHLGEAAAARSREDQVDSIPRKGRGERVKKRLICTAAVGAVLAGVVAASALAITTTVRVANLKFTVGGTPSPRTLPKKKLAPVALKVSGKIQTTDGTHPPALREAIVEEKNAVVNAEGVPVCRGSQLEARDTKAAKRVCGRSIIGRGSAHAEISFVEQKPIKVPSPLLIFNGGAKHGRTTMYVHAFIAVPVPAAIVTTITIKKVHNGLYAVVKVPVSRAAAGRRWTSRSRSARRSSPRSTTKHTYWAARCPHGHFTPKLVKAVFKNEAKVEGVAPEAVLSGHLVVPCTPRGSLND